MRIITIALLATLATLAPAQAQDVRFHDAAGDVTGSAHREQRRDHVPRRQRARHRFD